MLPRSQIDRSSLSSQLLDLSTASHKLDYTRGRIQDRLRDLVDQFNDQLLQLREINRLTNEAFTALFARDGLVAEVNATVHVQSLHLANEYREAIDDCNRARDFLCFIRRATSVVKVLAGLGATRREQPATRYRRSQTVTDGYRRSTDGYRRWEQTGVHCNDYF